jgi:hypothetical protein
MRLGEARWPRAAKLPKMLPQKQLLWQRRRMTTRQRDAYCAPESATSLGIEDALADPPQSRTLRLIVAEVVHRPAASLAQSVRKAKAKRYRRKGRIRKA